MYKFEICVPIETGFKRLKQAERHNFSCFLEAWILALGTFREVFIQWDCEQTMKMVLSDR